MSAIQLFNNGEFRLRVTPEGDTFSVEALELAQALSMRDGYTLVRNLPSEEKGQHVLERADSWFVTEPGFYRVLAQRQAGRIKDDAVRHQVERFQRWVFHEVLPAIRKQGGYVSPAATIEQRAAILDINAAQARVLQNLSGIVDPTWLESKARHLAARALGEEPHEDPAKRLLTVGEYLEEKGLSAAAIRKTSSRFGRSLKAAYTQLHGKPPGSSRRFVDGAQRDVAVYTEADRHLFDTVWLEFSSAAA
jgi:prophage antirepressor-like protein